MALNVNLTPAGTLPDGRRAVVDARTVPIRATATSSCRRRSASSATTAWSRSLTKRFSEGNSFQLSYHLSKAQRHRLRQRLHRLRHLHLAVRSARHPTVDRGPSDFDMRNRFSATLRRTSRRWRRTAWPARCSTTGSCRRALIASDGFRFNATTGQDGNGDTIFNDRPVGQGYNRFELPGYVTLDLRLDRSIPIGAGRRLELIARRLQPDQPAEPHQRQPHVGAERHRQRQLQHADRRRDGAPVPAGRALRF